MGASASVAGCASSGLPSDASVACLLADGWELAAAGACAAKGLAALAPGGSALPFAASVACLPAPGGGLPTAGACTAGRLAGLAPCSSGLPSDPPGVCLLAADWGVAPAGACAAGGLAVTAPGRSGLPSEASVFCLLAAGCGLACDGVTEPDKASSAASLCSPSSMPCPPAPPTADACAEAASPGCLCGSSGEVGCAAALAAGGLAEVRACLRAAKVAALSFLYSSNCVRLGSQQPSAQGSPLRPDTA